MSPSGFRRRVLLRQFVSGASNVHHSPRILAGIDNLLHALHAFKPLWAPLLVQASPPRADWP